MRIHHIALWTNDIERLKNFYVLFFNGKPNAKYINYKKNFESYFIAFDAETSLEIMQIPSIVLKNDNQQCIGLTHIAFSTGSRNMVDILTDKLRNEGYTIISNPRVTGDGYYESVVLDPDGNNIEITE